MSCTDIRPLLSFYIDGEATPVERAQVEQHLAHCQACKRQMAAYRVMGADIRSMPLPAPPASLRRDVWRAIEAKQAGPRVFGGAPARSREASPPRAQARRGPTLVTIFANVGNGWARAVPAALLVAVLLLAVTALIIRQPGTPGLAEIIENGDITDYTQPVHVRFNAQVLSDQARAYTSVRRMDGQTPYTVTVTSEFKRNTATTGVLTLKPEPAWEAGATYEIYIDCPKIGLDVVGGYMGTEPMKLGFRAAAHTPTPTNSPTNTPTPTNTPVPPTNTPGPSVAETSPTAPVASVPTNVPAATKVASVTPSGKASPTSRTNPTNTQLAATAITPPIPTVTAAPSNTVSPSQTPIVIPTPTQPIVPTATVTNTVVLATSTATPVRGTPTATATPTSTTQPKITATPTQRVSPTATPPCTTMPVRGFGKIWKANSQVRTKVGCPTSPEGAISPTAHQRFENGYMFWRGDTRTIYVFLGAQNDAFGGWHQFADTWHDTDPTPQPLGAPPKLFEPVRGFGKVWRENDHIRQQIGWAVEQESSIDAVWQSYERGYALWTSDKVIRFLYSADGLYARFEDIFTEMSSQE